jgi:hypothetical protein
LLCAEKSEDVRCGERLAEEVALPESAAELVHSPSLCGLFDPFGDGGQAK